MHDVSYSRMRRKGSERFLRALARKYAMELEQMDEGAEDSVRRAMKERALALLRAHIEKRGWR